jgi:hypothetical protein
MNIKSLLLKLIGPVIELIKTIFLINYGRGIAEKRALKKQLKEEQRKNEIEESNKRKSTVVILDELRRDYTRD